MNREELYVLHNNLTAAARRLMQAKNQDYGESADPFRNFRRWGLLGILVRMGDKLARLETFVERGDLKVIDEQVRDTVLDIINYAVLFEGYNQDANDKGSGIGNTEKSGPAWAVEPRPGPLRVNSRAGDFGGDSRGARCITPAKTWSPADIISQGFKVGTGPSDRRGKSVGRQSRHRKVTR